MRRYPSSTIYRYMHLSSTQIIQTHISHIHNTTLPQTLVQAPTHCPPAPPTPPQPKHRHTSNNPPLHVELLKPKHNPLVNSLPSPPTPPRAKHIHISHTPPTALISRITLIYNTSASLDTTSEPRVPPTCYALTHAPLQYISIHTRNTNNSACIAVTTTTAST